MQFDIKKKNDSALLTLYTGPHNIIVLIELGTIQNPTFLLYTTLLFLGLSSKQADTWRFSRLGPGAGFKGKIDYIKRIKK